MKPLTIEEVFAETLYAKYLKWIEEGKPEKE